MRPYRPLDVPLEGTTLIEASAGTGKTHALCELYQRLLLEGGLMPEQILVLTFTEAATEELRHRVRTKLCETRDSLAVGAPDDFVAVLAERAGGRQTALGHLTRALRNFDQAAIHTIHGFCRGVLRDNAFESGSTFDTELIRDQADLKREAIEDFWRRHLYTAPRQLVRHVLEMDISPQKWLADLGRFTANPDIRVIPEVAPVADEALRGAVDDLAADLQALAGNWPSMRDDVARLLCDPALNATSYGNFRPGRRDPAKTQREEKITDLLRPVDIYWAAWDPLAPHPLWEKLDRMTAGALQRATKKGQATPAHPFFDACERLAARDGDLQLMLEQQVLWLEREMLAFLHCELPRRKRKHNVQHFDDLLLRLWERLRSPGGEDLAAAVREKHRAALIDEFQDTDPIQYELLATIFRSPGGCLIFIGDPKQAIYSFRGADVFAYLEAARHVDRSYTLTTNWRSEPELITAVNTLFSGHANPFIHGEIEFHPVQPASGKSREPLLESGRNRGPLTLWIVKSVADGEESRAWAKEEAQKAIRDAVAAEIIRLLRGAAAGEVRLRSQSQQEASPTEEPLKESDIAVLVRTNEEARRMQQTLTARGVPSVLTTEQDVFDSPEAMELERVLTAIAAPHQEGFIRSALATPLLGVQGEEIARLLKADLEWEQVIVRFRRALQLWHEEGFFAMLRRFLVEERVRSRLMALADGERRITNLLHLMEILHQRTVEENLGVTDLVKWLATQRDPRQRGGVEHQLRMESDDHAVRLVTIHKSKGLEYPVVFCPFSWSGLTPQKGHKPFTFHDEDCGGVLTLDLARSGNEGQRAVAAREALAESLRLLYVALTRARKRCYLVWGHFNEAGTSSLAYLFHHRDGCAGPSLVKEMRATYEKLGGEGIEAALQQIAAGTRGAVELAPLPPPDERGLAPPGERGPTLTCRAFTRRLDRSWRVTSFSGLISGFSTESELPDRDGMGGHQRAAEEGVQEAGVPAPPRDILAFPAGARAGTLVHDILEHLEFTNASPALVAELVAGKLEQHGFEAIWRDALCGMIRKLLAVPLGEEPARPFRLTDVPARERMREMEFYFPVRFLDSQLLQRIFARWSRSQGGSNPPPDALLPARLEAASPRCWLENVARLNFQPVKGFMRGFIDLVFHHGGRFYLVDWKTNLLGDRPEDYQPEALIAAMGMGHYYLQYHLYTVALHRYLSTRLAGYRYDRDFGGVYYFFLRGLDPSSTVRRGVFHDRPLSGLIEELSTAIADASPAAP
jgi:exodeoxyribonuclease V beta subunit